MSSTGRQQLYYEARQPQRIGVPIASSHLDTGVSQRDHQIVVVSGSTSCSGCVSDFHLPCDCPSCEAKNMLTLGERTSLEDHDRQLYSYPMDQSGQAEEDEDDGIVHEFTTESGERHVVIMTKADEEQQEGISAQERLRRQKLSESARNRYALLSEEEKRAVTERRVIMRQRRKQKEREMEELEAILRASNDITDDLIPMDDAVLQRKRAKANRYQSMNMDERREYNQRRRLRQLGLPENVSELEPDKLETIKKHINDVNARKAEAARQRYHRMSPQERKAYNRRRTESFRKRRVEEEKLLSTPAGQITPEALEKAQSIMLRNAKRAEQARLRYQKKQQDKGIVSRRQRKPKIEHQRPALVSSEPSLDQILDTIERDVIRKTVEARQALIRKQHLEPKKEDTGGDHERTFAQDGQTSPISQIVHASAGNSAQNIVQYVQVPAQNVQNGLILTENKFVPASSSHSAYTLEPRTQRGADAGITSYYPVSIIQHESPQRSSGSGSHSHLQPLGRSARVEIVQPTLLATQTNFDQMASGSSASAGHFIHYTTQPQQYTIQLDQQHRPLSHRSMPSSSRNLNVSLSPVDEKQMIQKAKRAERARRRYHEMSAEARHEFNAKRAHALKMARLRDEELCRLGDELALKGEEPQQNLRLAIEQARTRRAKRAETARVKYQKMTNEQRKAHNAIRDTQRRQRKREPEDPEGLEQ